MEKIEITPNIFLDISEFMTEALLILPALLIWIVIIFFILLKSYQGIKKNIKGSKLIFKGLLGSILFSVISIISIYAIDEYPFIPYIFELISSSFLLVSCWGFKVLIDNFNELKVEENT